MSPYSSGAKSAAPSAKYADGLLLARLKAIRPETYREPKGPPADPQRLPPVSVVVRDFALKALARRLLRGETADAASIPKRLQALMPRTGTDARQ
jgi:hypothetical protein